TSAPSARTRPYACPASIASGPRTICPSFFFNDTATTEIYTLSLHDALPIFGQQLRLDVRAQVARHRINGLVFLDRKSTRLNSSHSQISYAVFCLKKRAHFGIVFLDGNLNRHGRARWLGGLTWRGHDHPENRCGYSCRVFFFKHRAPPNLHPFPHQPAFPS